MRKKKKKLMVNNFGLTQMKENNAGVQTNNTLLHSQIKIV